MRTHQQILKDAGGPAKVAGIVGAQAGTAKQWGRADSIPAPYWASFAANGFATLEELAEAAAKRLESVDERGAA